MRISRVYVDMDLAEGDTVTLGDPQSHYLKNVLRLKPGATLILFNGRGAVDYTATLTRVRKQVEASIESSVQAATESPFDSEIIQGLGRADHVDWALQKCTELGVSRFSIFNAARSQGTLKVTQIERKLGHWRGVAISACEQCGRALLPQIEFHANLGQALAVPRDAVRLLLDSGGAPLAEILRAPARLGRVALLLGPEGGLDAAEISAAQEAGFAPASLGPRVLRTETAAVAALAVVQSARGDM
jgi:16S rRNA (uracil1498-N3)-methyltransferase